MLAVRPNALVLWLILSASAGALAQPDGGLPDWVQHDPFAAGASDDPLAVDGADRLERVAPTRTEEEVAPRVAVQRGEVLHAISGVRETDHAIEVTLEHGLALVRHTLTLSSTARYAAEARYRIAVPENASLAALEVCDARGCQSGAVDGSTGPTHAYDVALASTATGLSLPIAHAALVHDDRGVALWLRAAPVLPPRAGRPVELTVRVAYAASAPVRGGIVRLELPARGSDDRAATARISVRSSSLRAGAVDDEDAVERPVERTPERSAEITARLADVPDAALEAWIGPCGAERCARVRVVARPRDVAARDVVILLDASPSTMGPARGRIVPTLSTLLASLPSRSRVRIAAFAARAEAIVGEAVAPTEVPLVRVAQALEHGLGSATRFEAAWGVASAWARGARDPLVVIVGDGGLTETDEGRQAFAAARRAGVEVASVNVADRATTQALRRAIGDATRIVDAGPEADRAGRGHGMAPLQERLSILLAPAVRAPSVRVGGRALALGVLRAGEELVWEGRAAQVSGARLVSPPDLALALGDRLERAVGLRASPTALQAAEASVPATCSVELRRAARGPVPSGTRLIPADTRRCDRDVLPGSSNATAGARTPPITTRLARASDRRSLPSRSLLEMLRQRVIPSARSCFRDDRAGRANYQQHATFMLRIADREITSADVQGRLDPELRQCLLGSLDRLDVPAFDGALVVRYPIYTAPEAPPPTVELAPDVADVVDAVAPPD